MEPKRNQLKLGPNLVKHNWIELETILLNLEMYLLIRLIKSSFRPRTLSDNRNSNSTLRLSDVRFLRTDLKIDRALQ